MKGLIALIIILGSMGFSYYYANIQKTMEATLRQQCLDINPSTIHTQKKHQICVTCINMTFLQQKLVYKQAQLQFLQTYSQFASLEQSFSLLKVQQHKIRQKKFEFTCEEYLQLVNYNQINLQHKLNQNSIRLLKFEDLSSIKKIVSELSLQFQEPKQKQRLQKQFAVIYQIKEKPTQNSVQSLKLKYYNKNISQLFSRLNPVIILFFLYSLIKQLIELLKRKKDKQMIQIYGLGTIIYGLFFWLTNGKILQKNSNILVLSILLVMCYIKLQAPKILIIITIVTFVASQFIPDELNLISWIIFPLQIRYRFRQTAKRQTMKLVVIIFSVVALTKILLYQFGIKYLIFCQFTLFLTLVLSPILLILIKDKPIQQFKQFQQNKGISLKGYQNQLQEMYED